MFDKVGVTPMWHIAWALPSLDSSCSHIWIVNSSDTDYYMGPLTSPWIGRIVTGTVSYDDTIPSLTQLLTKVGL